MLEDEATRAAFMDAGAFGLAASYTPAGGQPQPITGVFTAPHAVRAQGDGPGVATVAPSLVVFAADMPQAAAQGDAVTINAISYRVRGLEPDGSGLVRIDLERI